jgi:hypothetical protein
MRTSLRVAIACLVVSVPAASACLECDDQCGAKAIICQSGVNTSVTLLCPGETHGTEFIFPEGGTKAAWKSCGQCTFAIKPCAPLAWHNLDRCDDLCNTTPPT